MAYGKFIAKEKGVFKNNIPREGRANTKGIKIIELILNFGELLNVCAKACSAGEMRIAGLNNAGSTT